MMKAYGYLRVSGAGQIDGNGFDRQKKAISEFAKKSQLEIVHFYQEQVSGVKGEEDREVFKQMVSEILRNGVRTIVVEQLLPLWTGRAVNFVTSGSGWPFFHSPRGKSGISHGLNC